jgi:sulfite reductase (NADPH) flavoprotein alpha-component
MTFLSPHGQWPGAPAATVAFDPSGGRLVSAEDPRTQALGPWLLGWLRSLHYGGGLGLGWRLVIVTSGFCLPLFPVTGVLMWLRRRRNRRRVATRSAAAVMEAGQ